MKLDFEKVIEKLNFAISQQEKSEIEKNIKEYKSAVNVAIDNDETEEHLKMIFKDYLKTIYSENDYLINTWKRTDLAIYENGNAKVLIETKKPSNTSEMVLESNLNKKSLWELFYYYLNKTRKFENNHVIRDPLATVQKLVITNFDKFFVFDAQEFDAICRSGVDTKYQEFKLLNLQGDRSEDFYASLKAYFETIDITNKIKFYCFDFSELSRTSSGRIKIFRALSKESLLKKNFIPKRSLNELNVFFYNELLYLMGFVEVRKNGVSKIQINKNVKNTIALQIYELLLSKNHPSSVAEENAFELTVTWVNRLLFIKLFEGELKSFNNGSPSYGIFDSEKIKSFDDLFELFFNVLGKRIEDRDDSAFFDKFVNIPYLNSSLFEMTESEMRFAVVRELRNRDVDVFSRSVVKGVKKLPLLEYLIAFFNGYNFSQTEDDEQKDIINSSVLGLIFEKINGYKDGSFFTPYYITEFMAKEMIEHLTIKKANEIFESQFADLENVKFYISDNLERCKKLDEAIASLKICDPAVGSGHFLVSILNQILAIKSELGILFYKNSNRRLQSYKLIVSNDILDIVDGQGNRFTYNPQDNESQLIQESLFFEKKRIIENTLYGVDLNPNAVSICRLRLWIELLKNAYYKHSIMVTLPNIDVNIAKGNSLTFKKPFSVGTSIISAGLSEEQIVTLNQYKELNKRYISENNKDIKREIDKKIRRIKKKLLNSGSSRISLFEFDDIDDEDESDDIAFEWGIEFPETIDENGVYQGFDGIIANPPYIGEDGNKKYFKDVKKSILGSDYYMGKMDMFYFFIHLAIKLLKHDGYSTFITTNYYVTADGALKLRSSLKNETTILQLINFNELKVFDSALGQSNLITIFTKQNNLDALCKVVNLTGEEKLFNIDNLDEKLKPIYEHDSEFTKYVKNSELYYSNNSYVALRQTGSADSEETKIVEYLSLIDTKLSSLVNVNQGLITGANAMSSSLMGKVDSSVVNSDDGIFVLNPNNNHDLKLINSLNVKERQLLKPYFKNSDVKHYYCNKNNKYFVVYTGKEKLDEEEYPHIIAHFKKFEKITKSRKEIEPKELSMYCLHRPRVESIFTSKKIVMPYRSQINGFAINETPWYFSTDCYCLTLKEGSKYSLEYILGILNSTIYKTWFAKRGKMKGNTFEFMYNNLCVTPIIILNDNDIKRVEELVNIINENVKDGDVDPKTLNEYKEIDDIIRKQIDSGEIIKEKIFD